MVKIDWLNEENIQKLFIDFPMPLAMLKQSGDSEFVNKQFENMFRSTILSDAPIRQLINEDDDQTIHLNLNKRNGSDSELLIHSVAMSNFTLLVFDDTPGGVGNSELGKLRQRLVELEKLSITDSLTGAWNRLPLERTAEIEISRSQRYQHPISLIFFDIDHFKPINDNFGHNVGDSILKTVVHLIKNNIRTSDSIYRWGGEEFVVLATSTNHRAAATLAEKLRRLIAEYDFPDVGKLTISLGVAEYLPNDKLNSWLERADKATYAAKAAGRNQVIVDSFGASDIWAREAGQTIVQLVWHDFYASGNSIIDAQHEGLFELANQVIASMLTDGQSDVLMKKMDILYKAVVQHFDDEEEILTKAGYPNLKQHKQLHQNLLIRASILKKEVDSSSIQVGQLLEYLVYDVVAKHLLFADRDYFPSIES